MDHRTNAFIRFITDKNYRFLLLESRGLYKYASDEEIIKRAYRAKMGKNLNLDEPLTLSEKIQWLKLYDRNRLYYTLLDRYKVKKWVEKKIGAGHVADTYGVWNAVDWVEYFKCPEKSILKLTHNLRGTFYCGKNETDFKKLKRQMRKAFSYNAYWKGNGREWAYQYVDRRIMAEEYIPEIWKKGSLEYRITCFNGRADIISVYKRISDNDILFELCGHYDREWNVLPFVVNNMEAEGSVPKPDFLDKLIRYAETLASEMPFVRVDGYWIEDDYMFEGVTLCPYSGFLNFAPEDWDAAMGDKLELPTFESRIVEFPYEKIKKDG